MPYYPPASASDATKLPLAGGTMVGTITSALGTLAGASVPAFSGTVTWNNAATAFDYLFANITRTASAAASYIIRLQVSSADKFAVDYLGNITGVNNISVSNQIYESNGGSYQLNTVGIKCHPSKLIGFPATNASGTPDTAWARSAAGVMESNSGVIGTYAAVAAKEYRFTAPTSANGQYMSAKSLTELTTIAAAATTDTTIQMPAGAVIKAVSVRVTTAITCTSTFNVGDSGNATRFASGLSKAVNTTNGGMVAPYLNASALSVRITPDSTPSDATGRVRITIYYEDSTPPTS